MKTKQIRVYEADHDRIMDALYKLMRKWKRGESMPTVADVVKEMK